MEDPTNQPQSSLSGCVASLIAGFGVKVALAPEASATDDLGSIQGVTLRVVDDKAQPEITAFTLCHLFGHLIQLTDRKRYQHLIDPVAAPPPITLPDSFWKAFHEYEYEAFSYGATVLKLCTCDWNDVIVKYSKFMDVDFRQFRNYISTGIRTDRDAYRLLAQTAFTTSGDFKILSPKSLPRAIDWKTLPNEHIAII